MCGGITLEAGWWFVYRDALNSKFQREVLASHLSVSVNEPQSHDTKSLQVCMLS